MKVRKGRSEALQRRERDSLEIFRVEAQIQHNTLKRRKKLAFSTDAFAAKQRVLSKVIPRRVLEPQKWRWRLADWEYTVKKNVLQLHGLKGRQQFSDQCSSAIRVPRVAFAAVGTEIEENHMARSSA